jgi:hypothetical protein
MAPIKNNGLMLMIIAFFDDALQLHRLHSDIQRRGQSQWLRDRDGVYGRSLAGIAGSNPAGSWKFVSRECSVLSGSGLGVGLITREEECTECGVSK